MTELLTLGAVAYSPAVVGVWEGMKEYFADSDAPFDFVLYSNYGRLVDALRKGEVDIAWNTNLAYVRAMLQTDNGCRALAMRDIDTVYSTVFVSAAGSGRTGPGAVAGRRLALGSADSAHAAILPLHYLQQAGVDLDTITVIRFNSDLGKHGDTGRSEIDALEAVIAGEADVAAIGISTWEKIGEGDFLPGAVEKVWQTPDYSHCAFTVLSSSPPELTAAWTRHLMAMNPSDPEQRRIMTLEGVKDHWATPALDGYQSLFTAVERQGIDPTW